MEISAILRNILIGCFFLLGNYIFAQKSENIIPVIKTKSVYFELAGSGGLGSFNYETRIRKITSFHLNFRAGLSYAPIDPNNGGAFIFPIMVHFIYGKSKHNLDIGLGQSLTITTKGSFFFLMPASIGYRLESENQKNFLRFSYTPIISYLVDFQWQHWGGITFGIKF